MPSISQSVPRAFAIFKLFANFKKPLTAAEIAEHLDAPRSSCGALLKLLCEVDMLSIDRRTATYLPTAQFGELGAWINDGSIIPPAVFRIVEELVALTGETVTLASCNDLELELAHVERSQQAISFTAERGQKFPLWGTGVGTAYLSSFDDTKISALYKRALSDNLIDEKKYPLKKIFELVKIARNNGYYIAEGVVFSDATAIAAPIKLMSSQRTLVVAITGPTSRMKPVYERLCQQLCEVIRREPV